MSAFNWFHEKPAVTSAVPAQSACDAFRESVEQDRPTLSHYFRAVDHVETCVGSLHRTSLHLDGIRTEQTAPSLDRTRTRALEHVQKQINDLRDLIEHADGDLNQVPVADPGASPFLATDRLRIGDKTVTFVNLAQCIG